MNSLTLGCCCAARIGRADSEVASRAVDSNSRARQLYYPRGNFSVVSGPHQGGHGGSLSLSFDAGSNRVMDPVRLAFAFALYVGFLTRLSQPWGPTDIFSAGCHPSRTARQQLSHFHGKCRTTRSVVLHWRLSCFRKNTLSSSHIHYATKHATQLQATVKFHGVFASHRKSLAFAPEWCVQRRLVRDSDDLVTPFMHVAIQTTRHYATLREL